MVKKKLQEWKCYTCSRIFKRYHYHKVSKPKFCSYECFGIYMKVPKAVKVLEKAHDDTVVTTQEQKEKPTVYFIRDKEKNISNTTIGLLIVGAHLVIVVVYHLISRS